MSPFCILIFLSLFFNANYLWSLLFWNKPFNSFHIPNGVSLRWRFQTIWSKMPYRIILLTFTTHCIHSAISWASVGLEIYFSCEFLNFVLFQHYLHHVLPRNIVWTTLKGIFESQSFQLHPANSKEWYYKFDFTCKRQTRILLF